MDTNVAFVSAGNWQQLLITKQKQKLTAATTTTTKNETNTKVSIEKGYQTAQIKTNRQRNEAIKAKRRSLCLCVYLPKDMQKDMTAC